MDDRAIMFAAIRAEFPKIAPAKIEKCCDLWFSGERVFRRIGMGANINKNYHTRLKNAIEEGQRQIDARNDEKARLAEAYIESVAMGVPAPQAPPASIAPTPNVKYRDEEEDVILLSGPRYLSKIDERLEEALSDGTERQLKILHDIRKDLADFASEMPVTHMDIERTVGLAGLEGMDQVLVETLSLFFEDIDHYPRCKQFLSETFGVYEDRWKKLAKAAT